MHDPKGKQEKQAQMLLVDYSPLSLGENENMRCRNRIATDEDSNAV